MFSSVLKKNWKPGACLSCQPYLLQGISSSSNKVRQDYAIGQKCLVSVLHVSAQVALQPAVTSPLPGTYWDSTLPTPDLIQKLEGSQTQFCNQKVLFTLQDTHCKDTSGQVDQIVVGLQPSIILHWPCYLDQAALTPGLALSPVKSTFLLRVLRRIKLHMRKIRQSTLWNTPSTYDPFPFTPLL